MFRLVASAVVVCVALGAWFLFGDRTPEIEQSTNDSASSAPAPQPSQPAPQKQPGGKSFNF
jgi:cell division protein FtsN